MTHEQGTEEMAQAYQALGTADTKPGHAVTVLLLVSAAKEDKPSQTIKSSTAEQLEAQALKSDRPGAKYSSAAH